MTRFCVALLTLSIFPCLPAFAQQTGKARALFAADYQKKTAAVLNKDSSVRWSIPIRDIHDAQWLPNGHWLLQTSFGEVQEVDSAGRNVWTYRPTPNPGVTKVEIHAFRRLSSGETMIAESGNAQLVFLDRDRNPTTKIKLQVNNPHPHRDTRLVRPTPRDTFLVCHEGDMALREYDRLGSVVWEYAIGSKAYSAVRLENGNTLIGTGDGHRVVEVNAAKETVWEVKENDLPGIKLAWITMVARLPSGNTWIVNCHAGPENPQILEVTPAKQVVWSFKDFERFGNSLPVAVPLDE
jgi:outer membrane protein assembly factor BamB